MRRLIQREQGDHSGAAPATVIEFKGIEMPLHRELRSQCGKAMLPGYRFIDSHS